MEGAAKSLWLRLVLEDVELECLILYIIIDGGVTAPILTVVNTHVAALTGVVKISLIRNGKYIIIIIGIAHTQAIIVVSAVQPSGSAGDTRIEGVVAFINREMPLYVG